MDTSMPKTIIVIGAGIGGLSVLEHLRAEGARGSGHHVILIDEARSHTQGLSLPWIMRGWRTPDEVAVTPSPVALGGVDYIRAAVQAVDPERRTVSLDNGEQLEYHALVIAAGARNNIGWLPGLPEAVESGVAVHFYDPAAAREAHHALDSFTEGRVVLLVASTPYRCPAAPTEGALLAADLFCENGIREQVTIDMFTPEPHPMVTAGPVVGAQLIAMLAAAGIGFFGERTAVGVDSESRRIMFADGTTEPFDLLIFVPPHKPAISVGESRGWIPVDNATLATQWPGVWALGDIASVTAPSGKPLPKAATFAKSQAPVVASGVLNYLNDSESIPARPFDGRGECFVEVGGHRSGLGQGDFYALPAARVILAEPSEATHDRKQREEAEWIHWWQR
ncbi:dehydrogenase [Mycobacteroides chelonae]|jgi:sulfide:quinone oxidoreductase|uniref:Dehydrogenase n=2 Tax=Mycobacteroides chelonae TaxID=1774 RepID=A0A1S1MAA0_MYCCH|nr:dehydrogenase [Mycobacteroides chelonae]OHU45603.1 dehydrogenase [Mycobacteroides chelonae]OHU61891.1 dehydrogenase [Mycobacteroides chelonae]OHU80186.1 dehydrogenase [Mycobacteroides chelonae]QQG88753.1 NAD(P)/FAD-dependent oxidoreductase [Mycobacteroides chelonae]